LAPIGLAQFNTSSPTVYTLDADGAQLRQVGRGNPRFAIRKLLMDAVANHAVGRVLFQH
jgi:hypothetical protein